MNKKTYTVVIRKHHCINKQYTDCTDCPLCAAIREQLPEFELKYVGSEKVFDYDNNIFNFKGFENNNQNMMDGWHGETMRRILRGELKEYSLTFSTEPFEIGKPEFQDKPLKTVYVAVPVSITEQAKELIMQ